MSEKLFCNGGGCTAKLGPGALSRILSKLEKPKDRDPDLLVGFDSSDDAAVYRITDDIAVVQTLDFFPPLVEDPYIFGQIAATNALSDLYAMGATPKTALNIVSFPQTADLNVLGRILDGGNSVVLTAGAMLAGGHSIFDDTIKYGLSCMGTVHPDRMFQNNTPGIGDVLVLTKPLGTGIALSADRMGDCPGITYSHAIESMLTLNKSAFEALEGLNPHAVTDVTGFGLINHLLEMVGTEYAATVDSSRVPRLEHVLRLAKGFYITAAGERNRSFAADKVCFERVPFAMEELLFDPQTSGGLLISLSPEDADTLLERQPKASIIGRIERRNAPSQASITVF